MDRRSALKLAPGQRVIYGDSMWTVEILECELLASKGWVLVAGERVRFEERMDPRKNKMTAFNVVLL